MEGDDVLIIDRDGEQTMWRGMVLGKTINFELRGIDF